MWVFWKKSQKFLKIPREESMMESFHRKVAACNNFFLKKNKIKITRSNLSKRDAYTEILTQVFSVNFEKSYEHDYSARLPLK